MNEKPEETPNPLNPSPNSAPNPVTSPSPSPEVVTENRVFNAEEEVNNLNAIAQPTVNSPEPVAPKKKKTGVIIGIIISLFVMVGCGVAAALLFMNRGGADPVAAAVNKIMNGNMPNYMNVDGEIDIKINSDDSIVTNLKVDLKAGVLTTSLINSAKATLTATLKDVGDLTLDVNEIRAADGDIYLKVDGLIEALKNPKLLNVLIDVEQTDVNQTDVVDCAGETDCVSEEEVEITEDDEFLQQYTTYLTDTLGFVDGEWIRISTEDIDEMTSETEDATASCSIDLINTISQNRNSLAEMYNKNAFVGGTTDEETTAIVKRNDPVYRVVFDKEKLIGFMTNLDNSEIMKSFNRCQSENGEEEINIIENQDSIIEALSKVPAVYVEVNGDNDITRLYSSLESSKVAIKVDLGFSYPKNVNISEPGVEEYQDIKDVIQKLFLSTEASI